MKKKPQLYLFDVSRTLLFPRDSNYKESLNSLHKSLLRTQGYQFFEHFRLNQELVDFIQARLLGRAYVFTTDTIQEYPPLAATLEGMFVEEFVSKSMQLEKNDPRAYRRIATEVGVSTAACVFIDDVAANVAAAIAAGMLGFDTIQTKQCWQRLRI